jgi:hypothetical protein
MKKAELAMAILIAPLIAFALAAIINSVISIYA